MAFKPTDLNVKLNVLTKGFKSGMNDAQAQVQGFAAQAKAATASVANIAKQAAVVLAGLATGMIFAAKSAAKFQYQMAFVATMVEDTDKWMGVLSKGVTNMAIQFGQSTEALSQGLYDILSAGVPVEHSLKVLEASARAATAGFTDVGVSAKALVQIMNAMSIPFEKVDDVSDILFRTVEKGVITFAELAQNMAEVTVAANATGVPLEEVSAAIATLTKQGFNAAKSNIALARAIDGIESPTDDAVRAADRLGIQLGEAVLAEKGLIGVIKELKAAGLGSAEIEALFPAERANKAIKALMNQFETFGDSLEAIYDRTGSTQRANEKALETFELKWRKFKETVSAFWKELGMQVLPAFTTVIERIQQKFEVLTEVVRDLFGETAKGGAVGLTSLESILKFIEMASIKITEWITKLGLLIFELIDKITFGLTGLGDYVEKSWVDIDLASKSAMDDIENYYDKKVQERLSKAKQALETQMKEERKNVAEKQVTEEKIERAKEKREAESRIRKLEEDKKFGRLLLEDELARLKEIEKILKESNNTLTEAYERTQEEIYKVEKAIREKRLQEALNDLDEYAELELSHLEDNEFAKLRLKVEFLKRYIDEEKLSNEELAKVYEQLKKTEFELEKKFLERIRKINEDYQSELVGGLEEWIEVVKKRLRLAEAGSKTEAKIQKQLINLQRQQAKQEIKDVLNLSKKKGEFFDKDASRYERLSAASAKLQEISERQNLTDKEREAILKQKAKIDQEVLKEEAIEREKARKAGKEFDEEAKARAKARAEELAGLSKKEQESTAEKARNEAEATKEVIEQAAKGMGDAFQGAADSVASGANKMAESIKKVGEAAQLSSEKIKEMAAQAASATLGTGGTPVDPPKNIDDLLKFSKEFRKALEQGKAGTEQKVQKQINNIKVDVNVSGVGDDYDRLGQIVGDQIAVSLQGNMNTR